MGDDGSDPGERALREAYQALLRDVGLDLPFDDHRPKELPNPWSDGAFDPKAAKELIRYEHGVRGYHDWQSVGTEPRADFMMRLATVKQRSLPYLGDGLPSFQKVLDSQMAEIRYWLEHQGKALPCAVFAGLYPTGQLNARAVPVAGAGVLLLVNVGLMDMIFMLLKTNLAMPARGDDRPPLLTRERAEMVVAEIFNAYVYGEGSLGAWYLPRLPAEREQPLGFVLRRAEQFVLCHEIAHVALGHVSPDGAAKRHVLGDYSPQQEADADRFAIELLSTAHADHPQRDKIGSYLAGAVMVFFTIANVAQALQQALNMPQAKAESHPALPVRSQNAADQLRSAFPLDNLLGRAATFDNWLRRSMPKAIEWIVLVNTTMHRPSPWD
jgi:hypothetical protein